jgi:ABC-type amino acid transport substrate-binding protein
VDLLNADSNETGRNTLMRLGHMENGKDCETKQQAQTGAEGAAAVSPAMTVDARGLVTLEILDPTGAVEVPVTFAKRLDDLAGKTIAQVGHSWEAHRTHSLIQELLEEMYPTVKIVPYSEMPDYTDPELVANAVKEKRCDAVIIGNAA